MAGATPSRVPATPSRWPTPRYGTASGTRYPHVLLAASGEAVGLPAGVMGNSEVGHLTIGSGRVIYQDLSRINRAIADGSFYTNPVITRLFDDVAARGATPPPDGAVLRRGRPFVTRSPAGAGACGAGARRGPGVHPRVHRRTRHLARGRRRLHGGDGGVPARGGPGRGGHRLRALLRHGPRPALGQGQAGLRRPGAQRRSSCSGRIDRHPRGVRPRRDRRVHHAHGGR